jgi:hypothetical protein
MADDKKPSGTSSAFYIFLAISALIVLSLSHDPNAPAQQGGLLQQILPASTSSVSTQSPGNRAVSEPPVIYLEGASGAARTEPAEEYVQIRASSFNKVPVAITGWELRSLTRFNLAIPAGVRTLYTGVVNPLQKITLTPGETAVVTSGRSPLGVSFRTNICSAYLNQYQDFTPPFNDSVCPEYRDEEHLMLAAGLENRCIDYIESLPRCHYPEARLPSNLSQKCRDYIFKNLNYNACVSRHAGQPDFYTGEWRVYLSQNRDLWKPARESIFLLDQGKVIIDTLRY